MLGSRAVLTRALIAIAFFASAAITSVAAGSTADAATGPVVSVFNASGGVYWRSAPDWNASIQVAGHGVYDGDQVALSCWVRGGTVPPYWNNPLWYQATVVSGRGIGSGLVNDHFLNTGTSQPNQILPGVPACGSTPPPTGGTVINGINVGTAYNSKHWWGPCLVQDFHNGPHGHVIVDYTNGAHVVRDGMLWGWFDNGGAPGTLSCATSDEYAYQNGVRQDFRRGPLAWYSGWNHAQRIMPGPGSFANVAVANWMLGRVNTWLGQCRDAVNKDVYAVSGGRYNLGALSRAELSDYTLGYRRVGAYQVPSITQAIPGDIVNVGNGVHTYIIVRNYGGGNLDVVDSNHGYNGIVMHYHRTYYYTYGGVNYASVSTIWRLGRP